MSGADPMEARRALEALRAGVPNRAAIRLLGSVEDAIEDRFEASLSDESADAQHGMLFAGGFGTGKSHLLGYLREAALRRGFVVSTVSISKETPLSAAAAVFAAAMRTAVAPGHADEPVAAALGILREKPSDARALERIVSEPKRGFSPVFAAILHLLGRRGAEPMRQVETFLAGGKLPGAALRQALAQAGAKSTFDLKGATEARLAGQRERFAPLLFRAAGFAGWCVLLDEVELIGRYSPLQRARAYAELARWLGIGGAPRIPALRVAAAITDDFAAQVVNGRQDDEKLPERLRLKGLPEEADLALAAMRAIERAPRLTPPSAADLARHAETLRRAYASAYGWDAPEAAVGARTANRTMRHHIRGWITQWDVLRLQGRAAGLDLGTVAPNYAETADLAEPAEAPAEDDA